MDQAFGAGHELLHPDDVGARGSAVERVVAFGKRFGKELKLPQRKGEGAYFVDWILAKLDANGRLQEFVAIEIQTIDTTGTYRPEIEALRQSGASSIASSRAGLVPVCGDSPSVRQAQHAAAILVRGPQR